MSHHYVKKKIYSNEIKLTFGLKVRILVKLNYDIL